MFYHIVDIDALEEWTEEELWDEDVDWDWCDEDDLIDADMDYEYFIVIEE